MSNAELRFLHEHFARTDEDDDAVFYVLPRMVHHLDEPARAALTSFYGQLLPENARVLDLMSSWVSHLPETPFAQVTGLGMNSAELEANPVLTDRHVQNLNADPVLPFADASFDACLIALSVQYLTRPLKVFAEIGRVLVPGGGLCCQLFQPLLSDQGGSGLARAGRFRTYRAGRHLFSAGGLFRGASLYPSVT